jgi:hypothetical protein
VQATTDLVTRLRNPSAGSPRWASTMEDAADEIARLMGEVAALRLTLGGRTFGADVPEPVGCPAPGACVQVAEIKRLRAYVERLGGSWNDVCSVNYSGGRS